MKTRDAWLAGLTILLACGGETGYRHTAPIEVEKSAAFVQLGLPVGAYARIQQPSFEDLRVVDGRNDPVPFAILAPRVAEPESVEQRRDAVLYPLPARPAPNGSWQSPVEVTVEGDRINVTRKGAASPPTEPNQRSGGWLIDLGERAREDPSPHALRMQWSGPAEFSATFGFETSSDLTTWRDGGSGQLMALASASGPLTQTLIRLPSDGGRFVRLVWADAAAAPALTGAKVIAAARRDVALDPPTEFEFSATADTAGALQFDLGGTLPLVEIDLRLAPGTRVAPVRIQGRIRPDQPWTEIGAGVFYRLERGSAEASLSPPMTLQARIRYLRVVPDARAAALDAGQTKLVVRASLASLVFATQGQPPFRLMAGSSTALSSALPVGTLVPMLAEERARFGRATLGDWSEVASVAAAEESQRKRAALRPWLLWTVLLAGVAGLGFMVWRLARGPRAAS